MKNIASALAGLVVAVIVGSIAFSLATAAQKPQGLSVAERVCEYSNQVDSGKWEEACGNALDAVHGEYICDGVEAESRCWVRVK